MKAELTKTEPVNPESMKSEPMKSARLRLILSLALFALWIGYLATLVWKTSPPQVRFQGGLQLPKKPYEVLSRSQFLEADADVTAQVDANGTVTEFEVLWSSNDKKKAAITDTAIQQALKSAGKDREGRWLMPLKIDDTVQVAPIPATPGYPPRPSLNRSEFTERPIYDDDPRSREQERNIREQYEK